VANDRGEEAVPPDLDKIDLPAFAYVRRGYDPDQVVAHIAVLAEQVDALRSYASGLEDREHALQMALAEAGRRSDILTNQLDAEVTEMAARETEQLLESARALATETRARAESDATAVLVATKQRAKAMWIETQRRCQERLAEVEDVLSEQRAESAELAAEIEELTAELERLRAEADAEGEEALSGARTDAAAMVAEAEEALETARRQADDILDQARTEAHELVAEAQADGQELVDEAREMRERLLGDITRRRATLREQVEQLQAGRDRLLVAYEVVRQTWQAAVVELDLALPEARAAAQAAVERLLAQGTDDDALAGALAQRRRELSIHTEGGEELAGGARPLLLIEDDDVVGEADAHLEPDVDLDEGDQDAYEDDELPFLEPTGPAAQAAAASPHAAPLGPGGRRGRTLGRRSGRAGEVAADGTAPVPPRVPARLAPDAAAGRWSSAVRVIRPPSGIPDQPDEPAVAGALRGPVVDDGRPAAEPGAAAEPDRPPTDQPVSAPVGTVEPVEPVEPADGSGDRPGEPEPVVEQLTVDLDLPTSTPTPAPDSGTDPAVSAPVARPVAVGVPPDPPVTERSGASPTADPRSDRTVSAGADAPATIAAVPDPSVSDEPTAAPAAAETPAAGPAAETPAAARPAAETPAAAGPAAETPAAPTPATGTPAAGTGPVAASRSATGSLEGPSWRPPFLHHPLAGTRPEDAGGEVDERHPWWMAAPRLPEGGPGSLSTIDLVAALVQGAAPDPDATDPLPVDPEEAARARCDAAVADARRSLRRRLKATLADDQNQALDALQRVTVGVPAASAVLVDEATHRERFVEAARAGLLLAAATGRELAADLALDESRRRYPASPSTRLNVDLTPPTVADDLASWLADELLDLLRTRLLMCFPTETMVSENPRLDRARRDEVQWALRAAYRRVKGAKVDALIDRASVEAVYRSVRDHLPAGLRPAGIEPLELFQAG
jgi:cell division septum initiation protein DivIVA